MGSYRQEPGMPAGVAGGDRRGGSYGGGESSRLATSRTAQRNKKGLLGLSNLGNTCFMNSALQCLTHTHGLQKYFRFCAHAYASRGQSSRQRLLMAFAHWFERDWGKNVSAHYHSPEDILRSVQQLNPIFQGYAQQDSQEFLRCVLDNIHEELRREVPDDLDGHLCRLAASEDGGTSTSDAGQPSRPAAPQRSVGTATSSAASDSLAGSGGGEEPQQRSSSATHNLMQFCQSPEGATDAGEIRLPSRSSSAPRPPSESGDSTVASSSSSCPNSAATGDAPEGGEASSSEKAERKTHFESIVSELFQGKVVSCVRCMECKKTSRTPEAVYDVSVPIPNANEPGPLGPDGSPLSSLSSALSPSSGGLQRQGSGGLRSTSSWSGMLGGLGGKVKSWFYDKGVDVSDCLRRHCAPEYLTGKDQYFCERCKRKNDCEKRIAFKDLPEVLCIHIKRFRYDTGWFNGTKNSRVVTFPVTTPLDMAPFLDEPPSQPVEYRLIGLIQHIGSMGGGHYIAYCQHKRKPQDWYEFDDMQVSLVSAEQVERAEPYVLFYQRVPSKGTRLDRQTFKNDMRRMQGQVRDYLMSSGLPSAPSSSSTSRPRSAGQDGQSDHKDFLPLMSPQAVAEEMRHHGPALRNLYRCPASELDMVFVSKHWYVRLTTMGHPGPIDNHEYLCPHQLLGCCSAEMAAEPFIPISRSLFQSLIGKYGGGPEIAALEICPKCQAYLSAYNVRKQGEFELVSKYDTKDTGDGEGWYLVDALWVNNWKRYVKGELVTDVRDVCAPGLITNDRLFQKDDPSKLRPNLRLRLDYIGVNARVWWLFMHIHGGGPAIVRDDLEMYSEALSPETELVPEELRATEGSDSAMSLSRQFVDECRGDLELYRQLYPGAVADSSVNDQEQLEAPAEEAPRPPLPASESLVGSAAAAPPEGGDRQQEQQPQKSKDQQPLPAAAAT